MSQSDIPEQPEPMAQATAKRSFLKRLPIPRRRRTRFLALGAAVVVLAGLAATAATIAHHHERDGREFAGRQFGGEQGRFPGGHGARHGWGPQGGMGAEEGGNRAEAPAPLPALPADQAVAKAEVAVPGGKVDQLGVIGQQGGGTAWQLDVLGTDGVRHLVTVDGTGTVTSNTIR